MDIWMDILLRERLIRPKRERSILMVGQSDCRQIPGLLPFI